MSNYPRLKDLREDADKKQSDIAEILYMQLTQYGRYERGERELPLNIAVALAEYYNVSLDYIAGLSNSKNPLDKFVLSYDEEQLVTKFRSLSDFQKGQIFERIEALYENNKN
ncbi:MAG: helix-turn-helix domain-containing protein [Oscillospiraceae bacterium]